MTLIRFIGDMHGSMKKYKKLIKSAPEGISLQLGDFGVGFYYPYTTKLMGQNPPFDTMAKGSHYFIRGNHDNPTVCKQHKFWVEDGTYAPNAPDVFCIGGATSIDREYRAEGYTWWEDEELSYREWLRIMDIYERVRPDIVATHDAPEDVVKGVIGPMANYLSHHPSRNCSALQNLFEIHKPAVWLHGHHHISYRKMYRGVEFIGVGESEYIDLEI